MIIGFVAMAAGSCMSLGNNKLKKLGTLPSFVGSAVALVGCYLIRWAATDIKGTPKPVVLFQKRIL